MLLFLSYAVTMVAGIASLVCFILVIVKMFQTNNTGLGIACLILTFCTGIGGLIAFIWGWVKATEYQLSKIMLLWTICLILQIVGIIGLVAAGVDLIGQFGNLPRP